MTYSKNYTINPNEWEQIDENEYRYIDENLNFSVTLERFCENYPLPWQRIEYNGWSLLAQSHTLEDENNCYFYDALEPEFANHARNRRVSKNVFFDEETGELLPVQIPDWLVEHMEYLNEQDAKADQDFYEWAQQLSTPDRFENYDDMLNNAWAWYAGKYLNGGQYSDGAESMLYIGEQYGYINRRGNEYVITL